MFDSGMKASVLIEQIKNEADIALPIADDIYIQWLNALEQLLYTEFIQEQGTCSIRYTPGSTEVGIDQLRVSDDENAIRYEDIRCIYADNTQLIRSTVASGRIFPDTYYQISRDVIGLNLVPDPQNIKVIYYVRPALKTGDNLHTKNVMVPLEFIDLIKAKLRGEAYKLANEDLLAAKWLNDYNTLLEIFKVWMSERRPSFGM